MLAGTCRAAAQTLSTCLAVLHVVLFKSPLMTTFHFSPTVFFQYQKINFSNIQIFIFLRIHFLALCDFFFFSDFWHCLSRVHTTNVFFFLFFSNFLFFLLLVQRGSRRRKHSHLVQVNRFLGRSVYFISSKLCCLHKCQERVKMQKIDRYIVGF